jgi:hypothetical protein
LTHEKEATEEQKTLSESQKESLAQENDLLRKQIEDKENDLMEMQKELEETKEMYDQLQGAYNSKSSVSL